MTDSADARPTVSAEAGRTTSTAHTAALGGVQRLRPPATVEIQTLLRRRLRFFAVLTAVFYTLILPKTLSALLEPDATVGVRFYETFKCFLLFTAFWAIYVLHRRISLPMSRLRTIEVVLFGVVLVQFAWVDYRTLFVLKIPKRETEALRTSFATSATADGSRD